ncbi:DNA-3-methyladenine glycosylase 2 family protein [Pseudomonas lalucatii]|uniref:DNA-3-methyladenine glycosylase II n=1 Tax=Pseudomonas lalucatii TaxID=1424203 RepID=A0ABS5PXA2_9PSED|nr:DNA-3-methyladenine glycosylase [Pseudomonas lalucatii]MBS7661118.1 DNA-3-methyladenine glycosylase 2 family protein [Pseudomonas lalucatii]MBS7691621.1 DNA-3-methyladenine glycosylase 2 family protein [Pseudomonas lalucatii]MBS7724270.1 DNA-3-methyladenine glycosylase 2 family protein [Pseudomonas lalucatii]
MTDAAAPPIRLPFQPPWHWRQFHEHHALRALPGVERVDAAGYCRSFRLDGVCGWFAVQPLAADQALLLRHSRSAEACLPALVARVRRMFDLDAEPLRIAAHFAADPQLGPLVARDPGLRLPTAFDPFEQGVRAIVGQQVTVKAAVTIAGRLVARLGAPLGEPSCSGVERLFPTAAVLAEANLDGIGMPGKRVQTLQHFAAQVASGALRLDLQDGCAALIERLCALPGIGPWTAEYIALRAFGEADAFPASDLGLLKAPLWGPGGISARQLKARAEAWRPWRAYAAAHLWHNYAGG